MGKLDRCNDCKICGQLPVNETVETPVKSTSLSVDCLELKTDRMSNKLLHTESAARSKQVTSHILTTCLSIYIEY
jgi:3-dehydroquinate dehydratase